MARTDQAADDERREDQADELELASVKASAKGLPKLVTGPRRWWLAVLVGLGLGQALLGMVMAWAMIKLQGAVDGRAMLWSVVTLLLSVFGIGALRVHERVVSEQLGQDYVRQVRRKLLHSALTPGDGSSLGVTVARTTNDLTAVRNWVSQGVAPLVVAVPLLFGVAVALSILDWDLALTVLVPMAVLGLAIALWSRQALRKARALRRTRGRMAARIAETVTASDHIVAAGGGRRELRNLDELSGRVVDRAVDRAQTLGLLRSAGVVASTLIAVLVAITGALGRVDPAIVVAGMAIAGIAAGPMMDLGRVVEFRQNFLAARMVLAPALQQAEERRRARDAHRERAAELTVPHSTALATLRLPGLLEEPVQAQAGERLAVYGAEESMAAVTRRLVGLELPPHDTADLVLVAGENVAQLGDKQARARVGLASAGATFERGRILRAVRYRRPDLAESDAVDLLNRVGLVEQALPEGHRTKLRRGGEPLSRQQRARLALARAMYGAPELLIIDHLEADLDPAGQRHLAAMLGAYSGVVLLVGCPKTAADLFARPIPVADSAPAQAETNDENLFIHGSPGAQARDGSFLS